MRLFKFPEPQKRASWRWGLVAIVALLNAAPRSSVDGQPAVVSKNSYYIRAENLRWRIPYYSNHPLGLRFAAADRAVIILHGLERRADYSYDAIVQSSKHSGFTNGTTLIMAPQFLSDTDVEAVPVERNVPFWSQRGWPQGDQSISNMHNQRMSNISSFTVLDKTLEILSDRHLYPNLRTIVIAGHSAGGQFVNRYAATSDVEAKLNAAGIRVKYVIANAGSYLYFDENRPIAGGALLFAKPSVKAISRAKSYNNYKYGLNKPNRYLIASNPNVAAKRYSLREICYLLGERDNDPKHIALDRTPAALLQGANRLQRGLFYFAYLKNTFGNVIERTQTLQIVPNAAHSARRIFDSPIGAHILFDRDRSIYVQ